MFDDPFDGLQDVARPARKRRIAQILVAVPAAIAAWIALHGIYTDCAVIREADRRLALRTAQAEGTLVEVHPVYSMRTRTTFPKGTVAFTSDSGENVKFKIWLEDSDKIGMKIPVRYDPRDPENHAIGDRIFGFSDLAWDNAPAVVIASYLGWLVFALRRLPVEAR